MRVPLVYRISRVFVQLGMRGYFRELEVTGAGNIPATGPVIFASNHPSSITDALILGLGAGRMLHFVAHSGLFRDRWRAWFLRSSGVIPVYRPRNVDGAADKNVTMFTACHEVLAAGGAIGIFPEGTSAEELRVQKLKTGTARIVLSAEDEGDWQLGVVIIPVGLNFESQRRFRSRVLLRFGKPIVVAEYRRAYQEDPVAAVNELTVLLQEALRREVVNVERSEYVGLVQDIEKVYKKELLDRDDLTIPGRSRFQRDQTVTREIARALEYFYERSPEVIWQLARMMKLYQDKRHKLRLKDELLRLEQGPTVRAEVWRFVAMGVAGLPLALYGMVGNLLPYKLTYRLAKRFAPDLTKVHGYQLGIGAAAFLLWYALLLTVIARRFGVWGAAAALVTLPAAGLFAREYARRMKTRRRMLRFAYLELLQGYRVQELRLQRRRLIRELDMALAQYSRALTEESQRGEESES
jgi:1-acyl-sn-glycerol-3-phosphate acyltransferase